MPLRVQRLVSRVWPAIGNSGFSRLDDVSRAERVASGCGYVKISPQNSADYPEFPDRTKGVNLRNKLCLAQAHTAHVLPFKIFRTYLDKREKKLRRADSRGKRVGVSSVHLSGTAKSFDHPMDHNWRSRCSRRYPRGSFLPTTTTLWPRPSILFAKRTPIKMGSSRRRKF